MSATLLKFPSAPAATVRAVKFTRAARSALIASFASRTCWKLEFDADDEGSEWAALTHTVFDLGGAAFFISAQRGGSVQVTVGQSGEVLGDFATVAEAVEAMRAVWG